MMYVCKEKFVVSLFLLFALCIVAQGAHIPVVSVTETAGPAPLYDWENLINDSGMSGDTHSLADTNDRGDYGAGMGLSYNYPGANLVFDLGEDRQLDDMWIWNYSDHGPSTFFGMKYIQIYIQAEGGPDVAAGYVQIGQHDGTAANQVDLIVDFNGATARYVKFYSAGFGDHNWSGGVYNYCGLGEVRFYDVNPEPDPEPDPNTADLRFENFGYYEADSISYGHFMDKIVIPSDGTKLYEFTNILHFNTHPLYGQADPRRAVKDAANLGYKVFMYTGVFERDHPENWAGLLLQQQAYYAGYEEHMFALMLLDEPDGWGWTRAEVESLVDLARTTLNDGVRLTVNVDNPRGGNVVPRNLDFVLHDYYINAYEMYTRTQYESDMSATLAAIRSQAPDKPIFIIGGCFGGCPDRYNPTPEQQQWYYETAINNPDIIGLVFFILGNSVPGGTGGLWNGEGVISSPESLLLHKEWCRTIVGQTVNSRFEDDFDQYQSQQELEAVYGGVCPTLNIKDHGSNGGQSVKFGPDAQDATHRVFVNDMPGVAEAFLHDSTIGGSGSFGFKAINNAGDHVAVYGGGSSPNYLIRDTANSVTAFDTGCQSLWRWQKVGYVFDGDGVAVYVDSELVYQTTVGWSGGFSTIGGFYELADDPGWGYIDDIKVSSRTIKVSASSQNANCPAVNVVNGSGITSDSHDNNSANMWLSSSDVTAPLHWIKFTFDKAYPITDMRIWNYNEQGFHTKGMKKVTIKYSTDDKNWTAVYVDEIPSADGTSPQQADLTVNFGGVEAKYVAIASSPDVDGNWSNGQYNETGLSEVYLKFGDPATCFDAKIEGYGLGGDFNGDCKVDCVDLSILADSWLECLPPAGVGCSDADLDDFAVLAMQWLGCIDPEDSTCKHLWEL